MIALSQQQLNEIREHGERDYPYECCGLLIGRLEQEGRKVVLEPYPISNAREEEAKRNRFLIQPEELLRGERYAGEKDLDVLGFYHSHPDDLAVPSQYDLEHAWPTYSYIVVSVRKGRGEDLRSWEMAANRSRFVEEEVLVRQTSGSSEQIISGAEAARKQGLLPNDEPSLTAPTPAEQLGWGPRVGLPPRSERQTKVLSDISMKGS